MVLFLCLFVVCTFRDSCVIGRVVYFLIYVSLATAFLSKSVSLTMVFLS